MIDGNCVEKGIAVMRKWKGIVANFQKQKARIEKQTKIASKKLTKISSFVPVVAKLMLAGGGNKANPICVNSTDSPGAKQLANLTSTLLQCEQELNDSCNPENFPKKPNYVKIEVCILYIKEFEEEATRCMVLSKEASAEDACECWTGEKMNNYSEYVEQCKLEAVESIATGLKSCTGKFSKCRKYEDSSISTIQACPQTSDQLVAMINILSKNKEALETVQTNITNLTESSSENRQGASSCGEIINLVTESKSN